MSISKIIIDGYNFIKAPGAILPKNESLELQRDHLIKLLHSLPTLRNQDITIVFDGNQPPVAINAPKFRRMKVIFSGAGKEADDIIQNIIRNEANPGNLQIVSSDRKIQFTAKDHGALITNSADFWSQLQSRNKTKQSSGNQPNADSELSDKEVDEWLQIFQNRSPEDDS